MKSIECLHIIRQKYGSVEPFQKCVIISAVLLFAALVSCCVAAASLYQVLKVKAELKALQEKLDCNRRSAEQVSLPVSDDKLRNVAQQQGDKQTAGTHLEDRWMSYSQEEVPMTVSAMRTRRAVLPSEGQVFQPCLQLIADGTGNKDDAKNLQTEGSTQVPWHLSFKRGNALNKQDNKILVLEAGHYFVYSQVWYTDSTFTMGHFIQRKKAILVGDEASVVILFRCIQSMPLKYPNNSCYTAGIAKLEEGDVLDLIIPRVNANISLFGDATFFGAIKLL
ncbi:tumor necrosis factor ligand superfamily member 13B [Protopterus annectens]|uniref:TNFSF13b n=1 Tax=Protopterus annectens TaxID=7888 RepID=A0A0M3N0A6_PROAN